MSSQNHRDTKWNGGCQVLGGGGNGELMFNGCRASVLQEEKNYGDRWWCWL